MANPRIPEPEHTPPTPLHRVWELTLRCHQACGHCGSRAAEGRPDELGTDALLYTA